MEFNNIIRRVSSALCVMVLLVPVSACAKKSVLDIQQWTTSNGANVYFVQASELPIVDIAVAFQAGSARDGDAPGLAQFTNALFGEGTKDMNADQIAATFDKVGATFNNQATRDMGVVSLRTLTQPQQMDVALATFADVLTQANFPQDAVQRVQKQILAALESRAESPGTVADDAFMERIYGNQPYAHRVLGNTASVTKISRDDLVKFYNTYYVAKNATVVIVGAVSKSDAKKIAEQVVGKLPKGDAAPALPNAPKNGAMALQAINYPSEQTHVRMGEVGINWKDPNFFALSVGNYTLGGGSLVSRLFLEVRQNHGLSYNVYSGFTPLEANGPFIIGLQTMNAKAADAIKYTQQTLQQFVEQGPTKDELKAAKDNIIGGFPLRLDSNQNIEAAVMLIGFYHLPLDFLDTYRDNVDKVTQKDVQKAFQQEINLKNVVTVTVGKTG